MRRILLSGLLAAVVLLISVYASAQPVIVIDYRKIYKKAAPGVVFIAALYKGNVGASGTGSIVRKDGIVLTNHHVIWDDENKRIAPRIYVFLKPKRVTGENSNDLKYQYKAKVLAYDADLDLAALQIINPPPNLTVIPLADSDQVEIGAPSAAIGHPEQGVRWTLTTGAISGRIKNFNHVPGKDVFQMETSINRGNSGGPLLDHLGNMIGVNTMIARVGAGGVAITDINFAIQSNVARRWLESVGIKLYAKPIPYEEETEETPVAANEGTTQAQPQQAQPSDKPNTNEGSVAVANQNAGSESTQDTQHQQVNVRIADEPTAGTTVSKKEKLEKQVAATNTKKLKKKKMRPKVISKVPPGKTFTDADFRRVEKEVEDMADEMEREFEQYKRRKFHR